MSIFSTCLFATHVSSSVKIKIKNWQDTPRVLKNSKSIKWKSNPPPHITGHAMKAAAEETDTGNFPPVTKLKMVALRYKPRQSGSKATTFSIFCINHSTSCRLLLLTFFTSNILDIVPHSYLLISLICFNNPIHSTEILFGDSPLIDS